MWTPKIIEVLSLMLLIQGSNSANYFTDSSANYSANYFANYSANDSANYSANDFVNYSDYSASYSANYSANDSANYSANDFDNYSANYSATYSANFTRVAKCCDLGQVYDEMSSQCAPGNFNLTTLRSQYMADAGIGMGVVFDTGAMKAEDCENGSLRCVHLTLGRVESTILKFQSGINFANSFADSEGLKIRW